MYYILGMASPMEQYKKETEGESDMPKIDFDKLADEVEKKVRDEKRGVQTSISEACAENLKGEKVSTEIRTIITTKVMNIMIERRPDLFRKSWIKRRKEDSSFNTPVHRRGAQRHEFQMTLHEDKDED